MVDGRHRKRSRKRPKETRSLILEGLRLLVLLVWVIFEAVRWFVCPGS